MTKIKEKASRFKEPVIACLGLSYKADIDDLRESPAVEIVRELAKGIPGRILVVEPHIATLPDSLAEIGNLEFTELGTALQQADIVALLVNHRLFAAVDRDLLKEKIVIDTRGMWR